MGRPPSNGAPAFRFNPTEVAQMETILREHEGQIPARDLLVALADKFSNSPERAGKVTVQMKQVWNWFQNRRYALRSKLVKSPGKLNISPMPREEVAPVRNLPPVPQQMPVPSGHHMVRSMSETPQMEFEAKSARDGAWYDVQAFLSQRYAETSNPEVQVRFAGFGPEEDEWVNVRKHVRQRSLPCEASECVAVLPGDLILCFQEGKEQALYFDAHVLDAQRRRHDIRGCRCRFLVRYDHDQSEEIVPLRKVCRRPETDHRLQQLHAANEAAAASALASANLQKPAMVAPANIQKPAIVDPTSSTTYRVTHNPIPSSSLLPAPHLAHTILGPAVPSPAPIPTPTQAPALITVPVPLTASTVPAPVPVSGPTLPASAPAPVSTTPTPVQASISTVPVSLAPVPAPVPVSTTPAPVITVPTPFQASVSTAPVSASPDPPTVPVSVSTSPASAPVSVSPILAQVSVSSPPASSPVSVSPIPAQVSVSRTPAEVSVPEPQTIETYNSVELANSVSPGASSTALEPKSSDGTNPETATLTESAPEAKMAESTNPETASVSGSGEEAKNVRSISPETHESDNPVITATGSKKVDGSNTGQPDLATAGSATEATDTVSTENVKE